MIHDETALGLERASFDLRDHQEEVRQHFRRNFAAHTVEGGLYSAGMTFTSFDTILPALVSMLGGPVWMVSLSSVLVLVGISLPSLFVSHALERLAWKKPIIVFFTVFQRLPYLIAGLCLLLMATSHPVLTLWVVAFSPFISGLFCGLTFPAWLELVAKTIPGNRMSSLFAVRMIIAGTVGVLGGAVIAALLARWPGPAGYGILHLISFGFLVASFIVFVMIKETSLPPSRGSVGLRESLAGMTAILKGDRNFRVYLAYRFFAAGAFIAMPFMSIRALEVLQRGESVLGYLVMAMVAGSLAGNAFAGLTGDRRGAKLPLTVATALYAASFLLAAFAVTEAAFLAAFFLVGFCRDAMNVASGALSAELPPIENRIRYMSLISASIAPSMLAASAVGTISWSLSGGFAVPALLSAASLGAALVLSLNIIEPRSTKLRQRPA